MSVLIPISAPNPNSPPSVNRVLAFQYTVAESTSLRNCSAAASSAVTMASLWCAFSVKEDALGHVQVGGAVHVQDADAVVVLDDRHPRVANDGLDERRATAGNDHVHVTIHFCE